MNKSFLKFIADFGPLLIFFTVYYKSGNDLLLQYNPLIIAINYSSSCNIFLEKKIIIVPLIGGVIISLFGELTLYFNNPIFIYMKPTIINLIFAIVLIIGQVFFNKNFLKFFFKSAFQLDQMGWKKLNNRWAIIFSFYFSCAQ